MPISCGQLAAVPQLSPSPKARLHPKATSPSHLVSPYHKRTGLAKPGLKTTTACPVQLATDPSVAPGRYHLLLAMTRLLPLVLAKPGLKTTMPK